tara:strand:- start:214227 stop:214868 length:642 start_codon:yes stop_codon:yes gene_type:complete
LSQLHYIVREPKITSENPPLLVLLHGYGSNEHDLFSFSSELPEELLIVSAQAPYPMDFGGFAWYAINFDNVNGKFSDIPQAKQSVAKIHDFIDTLQKKYNTKPDKTFLLGFSQGAILSYALSFHYPNKVPYVVALSGYVNGDLLPTDFPENISTEYYCSHGTVDQVLPIDWARNSKKFLEQKGITHVYEEFPVGHGVNPQNFYNFRNWISERL